MKREETILQTDTVRVRILELEPGAVAPCHYHTEITDTMFGLSGEVRIDLQGPDETVVLGPGARCTVAVGRVHRVRNALADRPSSYLLVQGVGAYDFRTVEG